MENDERIFKDFCDLVFNKRRPSFNLEKHYALLCFTMWVHWRHKREQLKQSLFACGARIVVELYQRTGEISTSKQKANLQKIQDKIFNSRDLAQQFLGEEFALLGEELQFDIDHQSYACPVGLFMAVNDQNEKNPRLRPTINKAIHYVKESFKASKAQIFRDWEQCGDIAPFMIAEFEQNIFISPWDADAISKADTIWKSPKILRQYLISALAIQSRVIGNLDRRSLANRKFMEFPSFVPLVKIEFEEYTAAEQKLILSYRSEKI